MRWTEADLTAYQGRVRNASASIAHVQNASQASPPKPPKYRNRKVTDATGAVHDSAGEYRRWEELQLLERAGAITRLRRQVVYAFVDAGVLITTYKADFDYYDGAAHIVEDHKSPRTRKLAAYRHKVKLMQAHYGIQIREVTK